MYHKLPLAAAKLKTLASSDFFAGWTAFGALTSIAWWPILQEVSEIAAVFTALLGLPIAVLVLLTRLHDWNNRHKKDK